MKRIYSLPFRMAAAGALCLLLNLSGCFSLRVPRPPVTYQVEEKKIALDGHFWYVLEIGDEYAEKGFSRYRFRDTIPPALLDYQVAKPLP